MLQILRTFNATMQLVLDPPSDWKTQQFHFSNTGHTRSFVDRTGENKFGTIMKTTPQHMEAFICCMEQAKAKMWVQKWITWPDLSTLMVDRAVNRVPSSNATLLPTSSPHSFNWLVSQMIGAIEPVAHVCKHNVCSCTGIRQVLLTVHQLLHPKNWVHLPRLLFYCNTTAIMKNNKIQQNWSIICEVLCLVMVPSEIMMHSLAFFQFRDASILRKVTNCKIIWNKMCLKFKFT